jgi:FAD/FMN-containing dehydrogenase
MSKANPKPAAPAVAKTAPVDKATGAVMGKTKGTVARGHTVQCEPGGKVYKPGEVVELDAPEIERLRRIGALVDPNRIFLPVGNGPDFYREDPAVKLAEQANPGSTKD